MSKLVDTFSNRLSYALTIRSMRAADLSKITGISKPNISCYISGKYEAKQDGVVTIAKALNVNPLWLMGYDVPMNINIDKNYESVEIPKDTAVVLVYGSIPAGVPMECIEDIIGTETIPADWLKCGKEFFALKIKGNSMFPEYKEGDIIILEKVPDCESGDDCVVMINRK